MSPPDASDHGPITLPGSVYIITSDGRTLNLPVPSPFPKDPLNWCKRKRFLALGSLFFFTIIGLVQVEGGSLLLGELGLQYDPNSIGSLQLDLLSSGPSLFMGIGACIWVPLSLAIGRRPVLLLCTIILMSSTLLAGFSGSFYQHLGARCLQGLAVGSSSGAVLLMIIDLTYIHQRPQAIAAFWCISGFLSNILLSPTAAIIQAVGSWRAFYWVWAVPCIIAIILAFLFCPETYYDRPAVAFDGRVLVQSATEKIIIYENWAEVPGGKALPDIPEKSQWIAFLKQLKFWKGVKKEGWKAMGACYPQILCCMLNPLVFWVAVLSALSFGGTVSMSATYVTLLESAPYNLKITDIAMMQFAGALGALIAWPACGLLTARICRRLARRNRGVRDAEHYLPSFILPVLTGAGSIALYGITGQLRWPWQWIFVAQALNSFSLVALFTANILWVTEAFPQWAAAAVVAVGGVSYIASFGMSFAIGPWIQAQGFAWANCEIALVILAVGCIGIPVAFYGKTCRQYIHHRWGMGRQGALRPQWG